MGKPLKTKDEVAEKNFARMRRRQLKENKGRGWFKIHVGKPFKKTSGAKTRSRKTGSKEKAHK
jgi:hypothetical protein